MPRSRRRAPRLDRGAAAILCHVAREGPADWDELTDALGDRLETLIEAGYIYLARERYAATGPGRAAADRLARPRARSRARVY